MGSMIIVDDLNKFFIERGTTLRQELAKGKSVAIVHLAGDATRISISRVRNNKCLIEITPA